ncbi:MAG: glycosyltransferase family 2 protein, partial [Anaerolineales bacterium]
MTTGENATLDLAELPKVTVVIPAYNAEMYLGSTIESALSQTYKNFEVLVVDDGSTDRTKQIGLTFAAKDARLRIVSGPNGGVARARNVGTELADGKYVAYLDADDLWHETKLAEQVRILEAASDTSWAACYALFLFIDSSGFVVRPGPTRRAEGYILARHLFAKFVGNGSSLLVRRDAALAVGGFDPSYADAGIGGCEDFDFELRLAARYRIAVAPEYLIGYRSYPGNMS